MVELSVDETAARRRLKELRASFGLPAPCAMQDVFLQRVQVGSLELWMVGLIATAPENTTVTGAAASESGFPVDRAYFELLERASLLLARASRASLRVRDRAGALIGSRSASAVFPADKQPEFVRASLSNGVALHSTWAQACDAAHAELVERDRVLRSFAGEYAPRALPDVEPTLARALEDLDEVRAYAFGPSRVKLRHVANGLFLFPRALTAPLVYGFGAAANPADALASAKREALQRLAFLWGEELPAAPPNAAPVPDYHQEFYLYPVHHAILREWLAGKPRRRRGKQTKRLQLTTTKDVFDSLDVAQFVDLTPIELAPKLHVAKAISRRARRLRFGVSRAAGRRGEPPHPIA
jgi:hypothetical protein